MGDFQQNTTTNRQAILDYIDTNSGGGGSQNLADVLDIGNTSGPNSITFDATYGLIFDNNSRLQEGTIDAGLGGNKGIAQICGLGYELKWEGGVLYVMGSSGNTIRQSLFNFSNAPTGDDDDTKGYAVGSLWILDDNTVYVCSDATTGSAVWAELVPTLTLASYDDDAAAGTGGLTTGKLYQTTGGGTISTAGVVMVKQ